jgi:hypothetical protein
MIFLIRLLKLIIVIVVFVVAAPFTVLMLFIGLYTMIPLACVLYLITGDGEGSFDKAMEFCFETLWCEIGMAPQLYIGKLLNEKTY